MENEKYLSIKLFKIKIIVAILISLFIFNWYCDKHNIKLVLTVSVEDHYDNDESCKFNIGNIVLRIDSNKQ